MNLCAIKPIDNIKKASVKLAFTFEICLFFIVENCVVFQTALPTECLGHACGSAIVAGIAVAAGMTGSAGGECGEGEDEEDVFHVFSLSGLALDLGGVVLLHESGWLELGCFVLICS